MKSAAKGGCSANYQNLHFFTQTRTNQTLPGSLERRKQVKYFQNVLEELIG